VAAPGEGGSAKSDGVIQWRFAPFAELTPLEVHDLFQARSDVFVVEQNCVFPDIDGVDPKCWHLLGYSPSPGDGSQREAGGAPSPRGRGEGRVLAAYCRLVPPGIKFEEPSIGRVVTTGTVRGTGLGRTLMREALARADKLWPGRPIRIGAQRHLERFYEGFGFIATSQPYDEDGILHIEMLRGETNQVR
jgi:ElaA protein